MKSPTFSVFLHQQDDARDEVREDRLQAEADADAEGAGEEGERAKVHADEVQSDDEGNDDRHALQRLAEQAANRGRQVRRRAHLRLGDVADQPAEPERQRRQRQTRQQAEQRDFRHAELHGNRLQRLGERTQPAENVERRKGPEEKRHRPRHEAALHAGRDDLHRKPGNRAG
jgi:hypothetical protein